jgi:hypothetical protein
MDQPDSMRVALTNVYATTASHAAPTAHDRTIAMALATPKWFPHVPKPSHAPGREKSCLACASILTPELDTTPGVACASVLTPELDTTPGKEKVERLGLTPNLSSQLRVWLAETGVD